MAPSTFWISMSVFLISRYWALLFALDPLRQMSADLNKVNEILLLFHDIVLTYYLPFLMEISSASRPWYLRHSLPIPPAVVNTQGVNVPCSMSRSLLEYQYRRFFPVLMHTIDLLRFEVLVRFGMWVTDPDIKECLSLVLPESTCMDIQSRILCLY